MKFRSAECDVNEVVSIVRDVEFMISLLFLLGLQKMLYKRFNLGT